MLLNLRIGCQRNREEPLTTPYSSSEVTAGLEDPECRAAALCAAKAVCDGHLEPLRAALADASSLRKVAFAVSVQGLGPLLAALPGRESLPPEFGTFLDDEAERCSARGARIVALLERLLAALGKERVRALPLKGCALVLRGDTSVGLRPMGDVDLLLASPSDVDRAATIVARELPYRRLLDTPRHLVMAEIEERVPFPGGEHPENPLRVELHRSFRLEVLGSALDATRPLLDSAEEREGRPVPSADALLLHLLFHAAEDFASKGLRGVQAVDFLLLSRRRGPLVLPPLPREAEGPVLFAVDALERLFPGTFAAEPLAHLAARVPPLQRTRAAQLPVLRHSRPSRNWTRTSLSLIGDPLARTRFVLRTLFPTPGEVKANVAPGAEGLSLASAWLGVAAGRVASLVRGARPGPRVSGR